MNRLTLDPSSSFPRSLQRHGAGPPSGPSLHLVLAFVALLLASMFAVSRQALATEPLFGFSYTTDLLPKHKYELEQWSTTRYARVPIDQFWLQENRTEVEYGMTDRLQLALYANYSTTHAYRNGPLGATTPPVPFSAYNPGPNDHFRATKLIGLTAESIYRLASPITHRYGVAIYTAPAAGAGFIRFENRLVVQRNFKDDRAVVALNVTYTPEWRRGPDPSNAALHTLQAKVESNVNFGATYRFKPGWSAGMEVLNERLYNSFYFAKDLNNGFYFGPVLHYGGRHMFATATYLKQIPAFSAFKDTTGTSAAGTRVNDYETDHSRLRIKVGYYF